jgi:hypothetical protein
VSAATSSRVAANLATATASVNVGFACSTIGVYFGLVPS